MKVFVSEAQLRDVGIPARVVHSASLAKLRKAVLRTRSRLYTRTMEKTARNGAGVLVFGPVDETRDHVLYGIAKAAVAQKRKLLFVSVPDITESFMNAKERFEVYCSQPMLGIHELSVPEESMTKMTKTALFTLLSKRAGKSLPLMAATSVELRHPDHSLDMLFPGVADILESTTYLIDCTCGEHMCDWLKKGHRVTSTILEAL